MAIDARSNDGNGFRLRWQERWEAPLIFHFLVWFSNLPYDGQPAKPTSWNTQLGPKILRQKTSNFLTGKREGSTSGDQVYEYLHSNIASPNQRIVTEGVARAFIPSLPF